ncbi:hypothetical protein GCM10019071_12980 [Sphingobium fuliginis]|uniref:Uncharacterized protein n=1 Tax=Sphingobium fuliginis (strain ATCC 27551) TaxID=336203 RepID=A0ABQ1ETI6_SPHSA|nr:hypothetical protein GCM10019071_12980 [Sphingobium fuliginis]
MVNIQPATASQPNGASEAGSRNTPDPIMLPITSAMQAGRPSVRLAGTGPFTKRLAASCPV